jgi:hypothetical protein
VGESQEQRQNYRARQSSDKDCAAKRPAQNNLATPGLLGRIRRLWRRAVPLNHRGIGLSFSVVH